MFKIGELSTKAANFVLYYRGDDKNGNPYWIYRVWYSRGKHKKLICKYANLFSATEFINDFVQHFDEEGNDREKTCLYDQAAVEDWIEAYFM